MKRDHGNLGRSAESGPSSREAWPYSFLSSSGWTCCWTDPDAKCKMLKIAETYEQLSVRAVQRLGHHSSTTIRNWRR